MPGAHKIGAAISGPRMTGGKIMDITLFFLILRLRHISIVLQDGRGRMSVTLPLPCCPLQVHRVVSIAEVQGVAAASLEIQTTLIFFLCHSAFGKKQGGTGSVRFGYRFGNGTIRAVPVFGSGGSSKEVVFVVFQYSFTERTVPVPVSVPGKPDRILKIRSLEPQGKLLQLSGVIRANRFAWFVRKSGDSCESDIRVIQANRPDAL